MHGINVLVTRPAHQAGALCTGIEAAGGHALRQPLQQIKAPQDVPAALQGLAWAQTAGDVIFTSANAVNRAWQLQPELHLRGRLVAVGQSTARILESRTGRSVVIPQTEYSGKGILALPIFTRPQGCQVALVTGEGGRRYLPETLVARGASVQTVCVYRRLPVAVTAQRLRVLLETCDIAVITSGGGLEHLVAVTPHAQRQQLFALQLVVPSQRVVKRALDLGFTAKPLRPSRMEDAAIVAALLRWAKDHYK